jgi:SAM-dependent methyltransferase
MRAGEKGQVLLAAAPRTAAVVDCPLCGSAKCSFKFHSPDRLHGVPGEFTYRRCHDCRTVFQDPRVVTEDLSLCYPDEYFTHQSPDVSLAPIAGAATSQTALRLRALLRQAVIAAVRQEPMRGAIGWLGRLMAKSRRMRKRAFNSSVMDEMLPFKPGVVRALEVGCGAGHMLKQLARADWQVEGVEWDEKAAEIARRTTGQQVTVGDFQNIALPPAAYDLVVLHHVFEHLPDTLGCLRKIADTLAPGGRAVLVYPNIESLGARVFRENWFPWEIPRHLVFPTARAIKKAANDIGLVTASLRSSAGAADWIIACSRLYRQHEQFNYYNLSITFHDRLLSLCERALMAIGFKHGEELVVVLKKPY